MRSLFSTTEKTITPDTIDKYILKHLRNNADGLTNAECMTIALGIPRVVDSKQFASYSSLQRLIKLGKARKSESTKKYYAK